MAEMDEVNSDRPVGTEAYLSESDEHVALRQEVVVIETPEAFAALRQPWSVLAAAADDGSPCLTFEYCELAATHVIAAGGVVNVALVWRGDELLSLWPVSIVRKGVVRIAKALTCGSDEEYGGPLLKQSESPELYAAATAGECRPARDRYGSSGQSPGKIAQAYVAVLGVLPIAGAMARIGWLCDSLARISQLRRLYGDAAQIAPFQSAL
jgi:hypothetical protein